MSKTETILAVRVPVDLDRQISIAAAEAGVSKREIILMALVKSGFRVDQEAIRDRRGRPPKTME